MSKYMSKTAEDLMEDPDFIDAEADIETVKEEFNGSENTLIVRRDGDVVGEIHENSMLKEMIPQERLDEEKVIGIMGLSFDQRYVAEKAEDLMNEHEVTVPPDESLGEIAFIMDREDIRSVPVEEDGEIIGVVHEDAVIEEA
ncbi:MAG: HPP family protein [Candidatus Nanohalobium sp.]